MKSASEFEHRLAKLTPCEERCVIINVHTELVSALAAHSARRFGADRMLLVDCDPTPESRRAMNTLARAVEATVVESPIRPHGAMLDAIFTTLSDERLFLLDSDAELRSEVLNRMRHDLRPADVYGSGWTHHAAWLPGVLGVTSRPSLETGWYLQRPWIPCVLFKRRLVADAIASGATFKKKIIPNDVRVPWLRHLIFLRFGVPGLRGMRLSRLRLLRAEYDGERPNYCYADTGALLHRSLVASGKRFVGPPAHQDDMDAEVAHAHGATRARLRHSGAADKSYRSIEDEARERLRNDYGVHA